MSMKQKIDILLIDDDRATNFLNKSIIEELGCARSMTFKKDGLEAINYLTEEKDGKYPRPDLILLDINMPVMDGWGFLDRYTVLDENQKGKVLVVMLTTSLNPEDRSRARKHGELSDFMVKPLTEENFTDLLVKCGFWE